MPEHGRGHEAEGGDEGAGGHEPGLAHEGQGGQGQGWGGDGAPTGEARPDAGGLTWAQVALQASLKFWKYWSARQKLHVMAGYCQVKLGLNLAINGLSRQKLS